MLTMNSATSSVSQSGAAFATSQDNTQQNGAVVRTETRLHLEMLNQPTDTTCGATCLQALYAYYDDPVPLDQVIREVEHLETGGTLGVFLACHALKRGYTAKIFTYNLTVFDPTWFAAGSPGILRQKLEAQAAAKKDARLRTSTRGYVEFLELGGELRFEDLKASLLRKYLNRGIPIVTGLSSTFLYRSSRELGFNGDDDDIRGEPAGHFVVLCGYDRPNRLVLVADPFATNPVAGGNYYEESIDRVLCSILLGVLTHDANLVIIQPKKHRRSREG